MMTKMKTSGKSQLKALLFMPLIAVLLLAFTYPQKVNRPVSNLQAIESGVLSKSVLNPQTRVASITLQTQEIEVKGKVVDMKTGEPIPGLHVTIAATTIGTQTDISGNYTIKAESSNSTLVFSFVGYKTIIQPIGSSRKIDVKMDVESHTIDFSKENYMVADVNGKKERSSFVKDKEVFVAVEENPSFTGGTDALKAFIQKNLRYPEEAKKSKTEGKVMVQFVINVKGKVQDSKVIQGIDPLLNKEAMRIVNLIPDWNPGLQNGKSVKYTVNIPIDFKLK